MAAVPNLARKAHEMLRQRIGGSCSRSECGPEGCQVEDCDCEPILGGAAQVTPAPFMGWKEIEVVMSYLQPHQVMIEWGSGGSTLQFGSQVRAYYSIEHDMTWCLKVACELRNQRQQGGAAVLRRVQQFCVPSELETYNDKQRHRKYLHFANYVEQVSKVAALAPGRLFDVALIDGRARVSCAIRLLEWTHVGTIVLFHDFWNLGDPFIVYFHKILYFYDLVESVFTGQTLAVLQPKPQFVGQSYLELDRLSGGLASALLADAFML